MSNSFLSAENKALIWGLLQEANAFINIPDTYFERVKSLYETIINEINQLTGTSLKEKNKLVIRKMMEQLPFLKKNNLQKPLEEVKLEVDKNFKDKQEEFIQLVNHNAPKKVNFDDKSDSPLDTTELNTRLNEMMARRNHDVIPPTNTHIEVAAKDSVANNSANIVQEEDDFSSDKLLSKLKRKEVKDTKSNQSDIDSIINTIETNQRITLVNQDKILGLLTKISDKILVETTDENTTNLNKIGKQLDILINKLTIYETSLKNT